MKTTGARKTGDLRPVFTDNFVETYGTGINFVVHEYNEKEGWCIVECWCSDHAVLDIKDQKKDTDLQKIDAHASVIEVLPSYMRSPSVLASIKTIQHDSVDEAKKEITVHGKKGKFVRKDKKKDHSGKDIDLWVLDEG